MNCKLCGKEFDRKGVKLFCSPKCHMNYKNWEQTGSLKRYDFKTGKLSPKLVICKECGNSFKAHANREWLCSQKCKRKRMNRNTVKWAERYYSETPEKYLYKRWLDIKNEVKRGVRSGTTVFTLKEKDLLNKWNQQNGKCALSGKPMTHKMGQGMKRTNASVDRIDNAMGYTRSNVRLVCWMANVMRHKMDDVELLGWCKSIVETLNRSTP